VRGGLPFLLCLLAPALVSLACQPGTLVCGGPAAPDGHCPVVAGTVAPNGHPPPPPPDDAGYVRPEDVPPIVVEVGLQLPDTGEEADAELPADVGAGCAPSHVDRPDPDSSHGSGGPLGTQDLTLEAGGGLPQHYRIFVPPCYDGVRPYGLAVVLHDADGNRDYLFHKWADTARDREYIVVLPRSRPTYDNGWNWVDDAARGPNKEFVAALVPEAEAKYNIARNDTVAVGLGVGATFAEDFVLEDDEQRFEYLLVVNPGFHDPRNENTVRAFVVAGEKDSPALARRPFTSRFRYIYIPELGPFYPGPPYPPRPDDPGVTIVDSELAIDWFHSE